MHNLLDHSIHFPSRNDQLCTLKQFVYSITSKNENQSALPMIVNIRSLNNYGRSLKNILTKNTHLLLLSIQQLDSILAECQILHDGHQHSLKHRLPLTQGFRVPTKFLSKTRFSRSSLSISAINQNGPYDDNGGNSINDDSNSQNEHVTFNQRNLVRSLQEKRSSSKPLCRVPVVYKGYFELLNENDQSVAPSHKLSDLIQHSHDEVQDFEKSDEIWPKEIFLRSSCIAYREHMTPELLNSIGCIDSSNESLSYIDLRQKSIPLRDAAVTLQPGQILSILDTCYAYRVRILDEEIIEQPIGKAYNLWTRAKSRLLSKKRQKSPKADNTSNEINHNKFVSESIKDYVKCQTQNGDIVYIYRDESGLFSPLNFTKNLLKTNKELSHIDESNVFQLYDLLSNFRFPISVRLLDGSISFDNVYSVAVINRSESTSMKSTKFRLLMPYTEHVVFACPLNINPSKNFRISPSNCIIIPIPIDADIEIQPCTNMEVIKESEHFKSLLELCTSARNQYQTDISLIHFPLQLISQKVKEKPILKKKRSQSEPFVERIDEQISNNQFRHSENHLDPIYHSIPVISLASDPVYSYKTLERKISNNKDDNDFVSVRRQTTDEEDVYREVDQIYDYIRSGRITDDVERIQAKHKVHQSTSVINIHNPERKDSIINQNDVTTNHPLFMRTSRFSIFDHDTDFSTCNNDRNVDENQAHALFLASKQREKINLGNSSEIK